MWYSSIQSSTDSWFPISLMLVTRCYMLEILVNHSDQQLQNFYFTTNQFLRGTVGLIGIMFRCFLDIILFMVKMAMMKMSVTTWSWTFEIDRNRTFGKSSNRTLRRMSWAHFRMCSCRERNSRPNWKVSQPFPNHTVPLASPHPPSALAPPPSARAHP